MFAYKTPPSKAPASIITVYKNGDNHFYGKKFVVNPKQIRTFDGFLDKITKVTGAEVAVRSIHSAASGNKIGGLEDIRNGGNYVAAGNERFVPLEYNKFHEDRQPSKPMSLDVTPVVHSRVVVSSRCRKEALAEPLRNRIIYVYVNGREKDPPAKLLLDKRILQDLDTVLQFISYKINLHSGAVRSIYTTEGTKIHNLEGIVTNTAYVAVGAEKHFVKRNYSNHYSAHTSPRDGKTSFSPKYKLLVSKMNEKGKTNGHDNGNVNGINGNGASSNGKLKENPAKMVSRGNPKEPHLAPKNPDAGSKASTPGLNKLTPKSNGHFEKDDIDHSIKRTMKPAVPLPSPTSEKFEDQSRLLQVNKMDPVEKVDVLRRKVPQGGNEGKVLSNISNSTINNSSSNQENSSNINYSRNNISSSNNRIGHDKNTNSSSNNDISNGNVGENSNNNNSNSNINSSVNNNNGLNINNNNNKVINNNNNHISTKNITNAHSPFMNEDLNGSIGSQLHTDPKKLNSSNGVASKQQQKTTQRKESTSRIPRENKTKVASRDVKVKATNVTATIEAKHKATHDSSLFNATGNQSEDADQIVENDETKIEETLDMLKALEVDEEIPEYEQSVVPENQLSGTPGVGPSIPSGHLPESHKDENGTLRINDTFDDDDGFNLRYDMEELRFAETHNGENPDKRSDSNMPYVPQLDLRESDYSDNDNGGSRTMPPSRSDEPGRRVSADRL